MNQRTPALRRRADKLERYDLVDQGNTQTAQSFPTAPAYPGATTDSERAKKEPLAEPSVAGEELNPGDRVESFGNFGKPTGEFGIVEQANEEDTIIKRMMMVV